MSLFEDVKVALRVGHDATDSEIEDLIAAAVFDMENKGVSVDWVGTDAMGVGFQPSDIDESRLPIMAKRAIVTYAKAHYGYDNEEAERFMGAYDSILCSLLNGRMNAAYGEA